MTFSVTELQDFLSAVLLPIVAIAGAVSLAWLILLLLIAFVADVVG